MDKLDEVLKESRTIKQFRKKGNLLVHPLSPNGINKASSELQVCLYTLGHLWLYIIFEEKGYGEYLRELIEYSIINKNALFEWEIVGDTEDGIVSILNKHGIIFSKYLSDDFNLKDYEVIDKKSKDKDQPLMRLTRLLILAELEMAEEIINRKRSLKVLLEDEGNIINATYLFVTMTKGEEKIFKKVPESFISLIMKNMSCYYEHSEMKYYPKMDELADVLNTYELFLKKIGILFLKMSRLSFQSFCIA
ncbi:MAG: hypothetical protein HDR11_17075 [Lachnospiraceae bacterium]|nr:hypothetical protein [Lachnospiraceae bacterium]